MSREAKEAIAATFGIVAAAWVFAALFVTFPVWGSVVAVWAWWRRRWG